MGVGERSDKILLLKVGRHGCQNNGLGEADTMGRTRGREGRKGEGGGIPWSMSFSWISRRISSRLLMA